MKYGRKIWPILGIKALEGSEGLVEAYVSVFNNIDYAGEVVRPGFFRATIDAANTQGKALPPVLWSHNMWELPLGITKEAEEVLPYDARLPQQIRHLGGLRVIGHFNMDTSNGRDAFSHIKFGSLRQYSIGYYVIKEQFDRETGVIDLLEGDWIEWSPVNFAANDATMTVGAKGDDKRIESTEHVYAVRGPSDFVEGSFKRDVREHAGKAYAVVTGTLRASGATEEANIRFDADAWSAEDARSFCSDNGNKGTFEPASKLDGESGGVGEVGRLAEHGARMVAQVSAYLERVEHVKAVRLAEGKAGRELSETNRTLLAGLLPDLKSVMDRVQTLLDRTAPSDDEDNAKAAKADDMRRLYGRMLATSTQLEAMEVAP